MCPSPLDDDTLPSTRPRNEFPPPPSPPPPDESRSPPSPGGMERDPDPLPRSIRGYPIPFEPWRLIQVEMRDRTDLHDAPVHTREFILHPTSPLRLSGNLFVLENTRTQTGTVFLQEAPLPSSRPSPSDWDLEILSAGRDGFVLRGWEDPELRTWQHLPYPNGVLGRTRALQARQRALRPQTDAHRQATALGNTWGDRSRDSRMHEHFVRHEIKVAARLGLDVLQLDDGWQKGMTVNSAHAPEGGGRWEGFWNADPDFWIPHPERFPRGLRPLVDLAREQKIELGLWYAPDSWNAFAHWERDRDTILHLYREHGIRYFKLDGINAAEETAFARLTAFTQGVLEASQGEVVFDLDITGDHPRPGYWGMPACGPLFLENRYTDWINYWPHHTLRNLWQLAHWVDPLRLRIEWLNPRRNQDRYGDHPLAPARWPVTTLAAITLPANPLAWCELQNLHPDDQAALAPLFARWRRHRAEWFHGTILPLGVPPDGHGLSAFASLDADGHLRQVFAFRGEGPASGWLRLPPGVSATPTPPRRLSGEGELRCPPGFLDVTVEQPLGFGWWIFD